MKKWCIKVTAENLPLVAKWFNENCQNGNSKDYPNWYLDTGFIGGYYHYPLMEDGCHYENYVQKSYTEITFEQFKEQILKEANQLQEILHKVKLNMFYDSPRNGVVVRIKDIEQIFAEYGING